MHRAFRLSLITISLFCSFAPLGVGAAACHEPSLIKEARPLEVRAYVQSTGRKVLTLAGYSGAGYESPKVMLRAVEQALVGRDPEKWMVNIGATSAGIGAAYEVAKRRGFPTMGIVSTLARKEGVALAKCVDVVFYVPDESWGGRTQDGRLSPTSVAMVENGDEFLVVGGGDVTRDEMVEAQRAGKKVVFVPADMNHEIARKKARRKGLEDPSDFRGAAHAALGDPAKP